MRPAEDHQDGGDRRGAGDGRQDREGNELSGHGLDGLGFAPIIVAASDEGQAGLRHDPDRHSPSHY